MYNVYELAMFLVGKSRREKEQMYKSALLERLRVELANITMRFCAYCEKRERACACISLSTQSLLLVAPMLFVSKLWALVNIVCVGTVCSL